MATDSSSANRTEHGKPVAPIDPKAEGAQRAASENDEAAKPRRRRTRKWIKKAVKEPATFANIILMVLGAIGTVILVWQTTLTRESNDEAALEGREAAETARRRNKDLAAYEAGVLDKMQAGNDASEARATAALEEARRLNRLTSEQIAQARRQTEIAAQVMKESAAQARADRESALLSRMIFEEEYMPKIVAAGITAEITDSYVLARVTFRNVGRGVAVDAIVAGFAAVGDAAFDITTWKAFPQMLELSVMNLGGEIVLPIDSRFGSKKITAQDFIEATTKREPGSPIEPGKSLYVFGWVHPQPEADLFARRFKHMWFCYHYSQWGDWGTCWPHNRVEWDRTPFEEMTIPGATDRPTIPDTPKRVVIPPDDRP